jgi:exodeoxyribonuclease VII small subunit
MLQPGPSAAASAAATSAAATSAAARSSSTTAAAAPAPRTFEEARAELEDIVRRLEAGGISLEESLTLWERGEELARVCQGFLDGARKRLAAADPAPG